MNRSTLALVVGFATLVLPVRSRAQLDDPAYHEAITQAVAEYDAANYPEARALFVRAHAIAPNARTLRGIGMASFELRDYLQAYVSLEGALASAVRPLTAEQTTEARSLLTRTATFVGLYRLTGTEPGADVHVDGGAATSAADGRLILAIGHHRIVARVVGREWHAVVDVIGGESSELAMEPAEGSTAVSAATGPAPVETPAATATTPVEPPHIEPHERTPEGGSGDTLIGVGVAALAVGVVGIGIAIGLAVDREGTVGAYNAGTLPCSSATVRNDVACADTARSLDTLGTAWPATLIAGGVVAAVGAVLIGVGAASGGAREERSAWRCAPSIGGIACAGTF
jgi:hypothetical protein